MLTVSMNLLLLYIFLLLFEYNNYLGLLLLLLMLELGVPFLHFLVVRRNINNSKEDKKHRVLALSLTGASVLLLIAVTSAVNCVMFLEAATVLCTVNVIWTLVLSAIAFARMLGGRIKKLVICFEAVAALVMNAFLTYILSPKIETAFAIDGVELILLPACALFLCVSSYQLGRSLTKRYTAAKLTLWLVGVLSSEFVAVWLLGTPHTLPTENSTSLILWLVSSIFIFAWSILGAKIFPAEKRQAERTLSLTLE